MVCVLLKILDLKEEEEGVFLLVILDIREDCGFR